MLKKWRSRLETREGSRDESGWVLFHPSRRVRSPGVRARRATTGSRLKPPIGSAATTGPARDAKTQKRVAQMKGRRLLAVPERRRMERKCNIGA